MANMDNKDNKEKLESQEAPNPERSRKSGVKVAILVLAVLVVLSGGGLAARYVYLSFLAPSQATATVPDNLIGEGGGTGETGGDETGAPAVPDDTTAGTSSPGSSGVVSAPEGEEPAEPENTAAGEQTQASPADRPEAAVLELYQGQAGDNERFEVRDMLPGDSVTKYFCIRAHHEEALELFFRTEVTEETKSLGDVLQIRVTRLETGEVLYDGPFTGADGQEFSETLAGNAAGETVAYYRVDVSLDTSVGNEYQQARLTADLEWFVKDEGSLEPPPTGVAANLTLWIVLAAASLTLVVLLILTRRKEGGRHEQAK